VLTVLILMAPALAAQQPGGTAQLSGVIRNSVTGLPVAKATIRLVPSTNRVGYVRTSNASGAFAFDGIAPGDYHLRLERRGYLDDAKGVQTGSALHLTAGQKITDLDLLATPLAVITGTVTDADGEPIPYAVVQLIKQNWSIDGRRYQAVTGDNANEQGEFRLNDMAPGRYYLYAARGPMDGPVKDPSGKGELRLASLYYPNAATIDGAAPIELRAGQELTGVLMKLPWVPCYHVRGQAQQGAQEVQLLKRHNGQALPWDEQDGDPGRDRTFDIAGVTAGDYFLRAGTNMRIGGETPITVTSHDVNGLAATAASVEFRAHVRVEGEVSGLGLFLQRNDGPEFDHVSTVAVQPDGTARLPGIGPARYILWAGSREGGAYVKSVVIAQQELRTQELDFTRDVPPDLEIVVGTGSGRVQGTVQWPDTTQTGPPFGAADPIKAVLVPQQPRAGIRPAWMSEIDQNTGFAFSDVPPGKYFAFVTANLDEGLWMNREFIGLVQGSGAALEVPEKGNVQVQAPVLPIAVAQRAMDTIR